MDKKKNIGQGQGIKGRFAGLPDEFSGEHAKIVIIPVPFDTTTTYQTGTDKGPDAIIEASRNLELYDIDTQSTVYQLGIETQPKIQETESKKMLQKLYEKTHALIQQRKFVVVLGGEHSISYAPIKAHAEHYGKLTVLQLDAHVDLQEAYEGNPWSHASVMARVKQIPEVDKIVAVGIRSLAEEELPYVDSENTFFAHELDSAQDWIESVVNKLDSPVYITFDVDVFDSSLMPATGTPEPGGLDWNTTIKLLKRVAKEKEIVGFDVVELSPRTGNHASDYLTAKLVYKLLSFKFNPNKL